MCKDEVQVFLSLYFRGSLGVTIRKKNMAPSAGESTDVIRQNGYYQGDQEHAFFNVHL